MTEIEYVDVVQVKALPSFRLWARFSNGKEGIFDFTDILARGGSMVVPLRDESLFQQVFVNRDVPAWPNGYEIDATNLHMELEKAGLLTVSEAAE